jgi:hypothetical protein
LIVHRCATGNYRAFRIFTTYLNPYKVKAYRRASARIRTFAESVDEMVREGADLTRLAGIGEGIAAEIREPARSASSRSFAGRPCPLWPISGPIRASIQKALSRCT